MTETALTITSQPVLAVADIARQSELIQELLKKVMVPGHHYGDIPGTEARPGDKKRPPVLLKPGAEKLCSLFRLASAFDVRTTELPNGHRDERVTCTLTHMGSGVVVATGLGSCSTMESKYRYRNAKPKCPECGAEAIMRSKKADRPGWYCFGKLGGCGCEFGPKDERLSKQKPGRAENPDLADQYNTVLKMAVKRAHVHATLLATAASDMFIVEEDAEKHAEEEGDWGESPPDQDRRGGRQQQRQQTQQRDDRPPPPEPTDKERVLHSVLKAQTQLRLSTAQTNAILTKNGLEPLTSKGWGVMSEEALAKVSGLLNAELAAREGAQQQ